MIMAKHALAAAFPAIHPLAVIVILVLDENGRLIRQHALKRCKELIGDEKALCAQPGRCEVDAVQGKAGNFCRRMLTHVDTPGNHVPARKRPDFIQEPIPVKWNSVSNFS
jgi:hypothetical protein